MLRFGGLNIRPAQKATLLFVEKVELAFCRTLLKVTN